MRLVDEVYLGVYRADYQDWGKVNWYTKIIPDSRTPDFHILNRCQKLLKIVAYPDETDQLLINEFAIYFKCTSSLVPTFKTIYKDKFEFDGNRAIIFKLNDKIPEAELKHCVSMALTYHKIKHLPLLAA